MLYNVIIHYDNRSWNEHNIGADEVLALKKIYGRFLTYYKCDNGALKTMLPHHKIDSEIQNMKDRLESLMKLAEDYKGMIVRLEEYNKELDNLEQI